MLVFLGLTWSASWRPGIAYGSGWNDGRFKYTTENFVTLPQRLQKAKVSHANSGTMYGTLIRFRDERAKFKGEMMAEWGDFVLPNFPNATRVYGNQWRLYYEDNKGSWFMFIGRPTRGLRVELQQVRKGHLDGLDIKHVALGYDYTLFVLANGLVAAEGCLDFMAGSLDCEGDPWYCNCGAWKNHFGILKGHPDWPLENITAAAVEMWRSYFVKSDGTVFVTSRSASGIIPFDAINDRVVSVATGKSHGLLLTSKGNVFSIGGDITKPHLVPIQNVRQVQAISSSSYFVLCDGSVFAMGSNGYGELGVGDTVGRGAPVKVPNLPKVKCALGGPDAHAITYLLDLSVDGRSLPKGTRP